MTIKAPWMNNAVEPEFTGSWGYNPSSRLLGDSYQRPDYNDMNLWKGLNTDNTRTLKDIGVNPQLDESSWSDQFKPGSALMGGLSAITDLYGMYNQRKMLGLYEDQLAQTNEFNKMNLYARAQDANRQITQRAEHMAGKRGYDPAQTAAFVADREKKFGINYANA